VNLHTHKASARVAELELEVSFLSDEIAALQADLAAMRAIRGMVTDGPPVEWDRWILALDDETFGSLLDPKHTEILQEQPAVRVAEEFRPVPAPIPQGWSSPPPAKGWR
jgi:hypothetical protein